MSLRKFALAAAFLLCGTAATGLAQRPPQMKIHFTISSPFMLQKANIVLPAGKYLLFQLNPNDRGLFALYRGDMTQSPVAILRTARVYEFVGALPQETKLSLEIDEALPQQYWVLRGWTIPGDDGFEVITTSLPRARKSGP